MVHQTGKNHEPDTNRAPRLRLFFHEAALARVLFYRPEVLDNQDAVGGSLRLESLFHARQRQFFLLVSRVCLTIHCRAAKARPVVSPEEHAAPPTRRNTPRSPLRK